MYRQLYKDSIVGDPGRSGGIVTARYLIGDVLEVLPTLEENSVDLILTSPPFLALRSYLPADHPDKSKEGGSQPTPGVFIDWLVDVVEALDRVLAPHGSMVIELGDTYAGAGGGGDIDGNPRYPEGRSFSLDRVMTPGWPASKSLTLIPELFRLTLVYGFNPLTGRQTNPWRLRNVIRWVRPNPPVGALGDKFRPATSELMVFCRTDEAGRRRYFDLDAVRGEFPEAPHGGHPNSVKRSDNAMPTADGRGRELDSNNWLTRVHPAGAPPLDWWNIPPGGYQGAHYAVFPEALCVRPIKAMCPERVCRTCGEPSRRIVAERSPVDQSNRFARQPALAAHIKERREAAGLTSAEINEWFGYKEIAKNWERIDEFGARIPNLREWPILKERLGLSDEFDDLVYGERKWADSVAESTVAYIAENGQALALEDRRVAYDRGGLPPVDASRVKANRQAPETFSNCDHDNWRPGLVLDPFAGSGTTLAVAVGHGRDAVGIDLDERNARLAEERIGFFLEIENSPLANQEADSEPSSLRGQA